MIKFCSILTNSLIVVSVISGGFHLASTDSPVFAHGGRTDSTGCHGGITASPLPHKFS